MKVNSTVKPITFHGEDGASLQISRSNMGEPYRDGVEFNFSTEDDYFGGFLEVAELKRLREFLIEYLGS